MRTRSQIGKIKDDKLTIIFITVVVSRLNIAASTDRDLNTAVKIEGVVGLKEHWHQTSGMLGAIETYSIVIVSNRACRANSECNVPR